MRICANVFATLSMFHQRNMTENAASTMPQDAVDIPQQGREARR